MLYWEILTGKFNISRESGQQGAGRALRSWYLRKYGAEVSNFRVKLKDGVPVEVHLGLEVPIQDLHTTVEHLESGQVSDLEGASLRYIEELIDMKHITSWSLHRHPLMSDRAALNFVLS
jgi:hypothetical protein